MTETLNNREGVFDVIYKLIGRKANSNAFIQGISGAAGFPFTLAADAAVLLTHYEPLINDIRRLYGRSLISSGDAGRLFAGMFKEILVDVAVDKVMGNIPVAGIYFNATAAKIMTWRIGMLITVISCRGEEINRSNLSETARLIRLITPQTDVFKFVKPDYQMFKKLALSASDDCEEIFDNKIATALRAFD